MNARFEKILLESETEDKAAADNSADSRSGADFPIRGADIRVSGADFPVRGADIRVSGMDFPIAARHG